MPLPPTLTTDRLVLRAFRADDAPDVQRLVSAREIALNTLSIPHPYPEGAAAQWIGTHEGSVDDHPFAITLRGDGLIVGCVGIRFHPDHDRGELGYWIGVPYWGTGYATEASRAVIGWAFETCNLNRIFAEHFTRNPASGAVMRRLGMQYEGLLRQHVRKWDEYCDVAIYSILRSEWP